MIIVADYCLIIESNSSDGDPVEALEKFKVLTGIFSFCVYT